MATTGAHRLTGRLRVDLPPREAFRLFTARGEQDWVDGWEPRFPAATVDDSEPGTVFETAHGPDLTTWIVIDRERPRGIRYARVTPEDRAGTVSVTLDDIDGASEVTVTYELTALSDAARPGVEEFAAGYQRFLQSWQEAIETWLASR
jgi:hypothetical protein